MSKKLHHITLTADTKGKPFTPQNCENIKCFTGKFEGYSLKVTKQSNNTLFVAVGKHNIAIASLEKHPTLNYWFGVTAKGNKIQVSLKKMLGQLRIWC